MTEKAKFKYSAAEGVLELEGSEEFVTKHFESLTDIVRVISRNTTIEPKLEVSVQPENNELGTGTSGDESGEPEQNESISKYKEHFSEINGKLKIVSGISGGSKQAKMTNCALLYSYGSLLLGDEQVSSKDIRQACEEHGILDSANYAAVFSDKTIFISDGKKGGNKEVKLTYQGEKKAKELLGSAESKN